MSRMNNENVRAISEYIEKYREDTGISPTILEIEECTGIPKSTVSRYLKYMKENGLIEYNGYRGMITTADKRTREESLKVPIAGKVSCGLPRYAEESIEEYVRLPVALFGRGKFFILKADGDSMINVGINIDDLVLIEAQSTADEGQIVVALVDNEYATLKRYYPHLDEGYVILRSENDSYKDQVIDLRKHDFVIQGIAVKIIKELA